ncbi:Heat shock factor protein 1 [Merluccius polli]|uniref:Heat shock factor protein 1 n=1 Tax=Merluccius polli TaxID=89951 RepID=A0AA47M7V7_MERPO|nr:Heat shock factor protein 1 [Merluccius polli]
MDVHGGGLVNNVPAFLTKLWTLVEDPHTDELICWSPSGSSFHVLDHARFSKDVLPKFFKHNNMASFIRQLNMYGFRKVVHMEHGGLLKPEKDDTEFQHPCFTRGQEHLLDNIKRKVTPVPTGKQQEEVKMCPDGVTKILNDMQLMKGKQENIDSKITTMKHENEALWREVATLRQKHAQQQKVVNKLIQFLMSLVQSNRVLGMKRKIPLMLNDSSSAHSIPKYSRQYSLEPLQATPAISAVAGSVKSGPIISDITELVTPTSREHSSDWKDALPLMLNDSSSAHSMPKYSRQYSLEPLQATPAISAPSGSTKSGPIISDITELATPTSREHSSDWIDSLGSPVILVKEEPPSPDVKDTPFSPTTTFINSILLDNADIPAPAHHSADNRLSASPSVELGSSTAQDANTQSQLPSHSPDHTPRPSTPDEPCLSVACFDKSELSEHLEDIEGSLENLHHLLNGQNINIDSSPPFFSSPGSASGDFDLDSLDTLLSPEAPKETDGHFASAGKQLVQYSTTPTGCVGGVADLPSLLQPHEDSFFSPPLPEDHPQSP